MTNNVSIVVPELAVQSEMNQRGHWTKRYDRKVKQFFVVRVALNESPESTIRALRTAGVPLRVTMTRLYKGRCKAFDTDNLVSAFKFVRDAIAEWLHRDDAPDSGIEWRVEQERCDETGVRITISEAP